MHGAAPSHERLVVGTVIAQATASGWVDSLGPRGDIIILIFEFTKLEGRLFLIPVKLPVLSFDLTVLKKLFIIAKIVVARALFTLIDILARYAFFKEIT